MLHPGHLKYLLLARDLGDRLLVGVISDKYANKGNGRPVFNQDERMQLLSRLDFIDNVILTDSENSVPIIRAHRPAIYAKGPEYAKPDASGHFDQERRAVESYGGRVVILHSDTLYSSTAILTGKFLEERIKRVIPANEPEASGHPCKA